MERVTFSEQEAIGIGYFMANNPNPSDSSLLVGSVNTKRLEGDRLEVAGKAFRLDGEFNVANRGLVELVEMFKADSHLLTTLLSLAQEQIIKMEKFGSVYADEVIVGHSNQGDFDEFANDKSSEALKDRIIAVHIPYNLKVTEEVKIYRKMMKTSRMGDVHIAPLTLQAASAFSVLARLDPPDRQGMSQLNKLKLYDGHTVPHFSRQDVREMHRHHPMEGMSGISPRYVMNRIGAAASEPKVRCITPFGALGSLWEGLDENVSYEADVATRIALVTDTVKVYDDLAVRDVQIASEEAFEAKAKDLLASYLANLNSYIADISRSDYKTHPRRRRKGARHAGARTRPWDNRPQQGGVPARDTPVRCRLAEQGQALHVRLGAAPQRSHREAPPGPAERPQQEPYPPALLQAAGELDAALEERHLEADRLLRLLQHMRQ